MRDRVAFARAGAIRRILAERDGESPDEEQRGRLRQGAGLAHIGTQPERAG